MTAVQSMDYAWSELLHEVVAYGDEGAAPRGQRTKEVLADTLVVDATRPVLTTRARGLGYRFLAAEAAWILDGRDDVASIAPYSKAIASFSDDGLKFFGAYGPRLHEQLGYVVDALERDLDTRQAVATIWRPNPPASKDVPCTTGVQFLVRDGRLHGVVTMRSSDVWLGVPYDVFNFSMLLGYVGLQLRDRGVGVLPLGNLFNVAGSRHVYERNFAEAETILGTDYRGVGFVYKPFDPYEFASPRDLVEHLWGLARQKPAELRGAFLTELFDVWEKK